jgi:curved DNA-binding protein CbpA
MTDTFSDFDQTIDYYAALGVKVTDSLDDIKKAHVRLALENHPDTKALGMSAAYKEEAAAKFGKISEAWAVLSKPDVRKSYDAARTLSATPKIGNYNYTSTGVSTEIRTEAFASQASNYQSKMKGGSGTWKETQSKYRNEKFQKMSLDQRKASRVKSVHTPGGLGGGLLLLGAVMFGGAFMMYKSTAGRQPAQRGY